MPKKKVVEPVRILLKKNDQVKVIAGRDRGKTGRVLDVNPANGKILVEHVSMIKRHTRPNPAKQIKGGIAERESPIAVSNVMIVCSAVRCRFASRTMWKICRAAKCGVPVYAANAGKLWIGNKRWQHDSGSIIQKRSFRPLPRSSDTRT